MDLVRMFLRQQEVDTARRRRRRSKRKRQRACDIADDGPAWMSPELRLEEAELDAFYQCVLEAFEPDARLAFVMVRELNLSYREVAYHLCTTRSAVHENVAHVERGFRRALEAIGIEVPAVTGDLTPLVDQHADVLVTTAPPKPRHLWLVRDDDMPTFDCEHPHRGRVA